MHSKQARVSMSVIRRAVSSGIDTRRIRVSVAQKFLAARSPSLNRGCRPNRHEQGADIPKNAEAAKLQRLVVRTE